MSAGAERVMSRDYRSSGSGGPLFPTKEPFPPCSFSSIRHPHVGPVPDLTMGSYVGRRRCFPVCVDCPGADPRETGEGE